jgi:hypothetical protein
MLSCLLTLLAPAGAAAGPQYMGIPPFGTTNLTEFNSTFLNGSLPSPVRTLAPITLLHLELNETTPSGVRYMAFEPKVIEIAVNPILIVILAVLIAGAAGAWYILGRGRNGG